LNRIAHHVSGSPYLKTVYPLFPTSTAVAMLDPCSLAVKEVQQAKNQLLQPLTFAKDAERGIVINLLITQRANAAGKSSELGQKERKRQWVMVSRSFAAILNSLDKCYISGLRFHFHRCSGIKRICSVPQVGMASALLLNVRQCLFSPAHPPCQLSPWRGRQHLEPQRSGAPLVSKLSSQPSLPTCAQRQYSWRYHQ